VTLPLFVYGSLRDAAVFALAAGRRMPPARPARAIGRAAVAMPGRDYPGLAARIGVAAEGLLLFGLTPADLRRLDRFEGDEYARLPVDVLSGGRWRRAQAYLPLVPLAAGERAWSFAAWRRNQKPRFLVRERRTAALRARRLPVLDGPDPTA